MAGEEIDTSLDATFYLLKTGVILAGFISVEISLIVSEFWCFKHRLMGLSLRTSVYLSYLRNMPLVSLILGVLPRDCDTIVVVRLWMGLTLMCTQLPCTWCQNSLSSALKAPTLNSFRASTKPIDQAQHTKSIIGFRNIGNSCLMRKSQQYNCCRFSCIIMPMDLLQVVSQRKRIYPNSNDSLKEVESSSASEQAWLLDSMTDVSSPMYGQVNVRWASRCCREVM